ncbi:MAG: ArsR/SmtB family transcription factor [Chloroflexota bacterium]
MDRLKGFMDRRLVHAMGHPIREHILAVLNERAASPTEIGDELELDVSAFYKHVQVLEQLGCIECIGIRKSRGFQERIFRAKTTLFFDDDDWLRLPPTFRVDVCGGLLQGICKDVGGALRAGTLGNGKGEHVSRSPGLVDERGREELLEILDDALSRVQTVQRESGERLRESGEEGVTVTISMLGYESAGSYEPEGEEGDEE